MTVQQIYERYTIPPNLQRHQLQVTAVGVWVVEHWTGPELDQELIKQALLLHDMGNIVKFKKPFLAEMKKDFIYWEKIQQQFIAKYGSVAGDATEKIVEELGVKPEILALVKEMRVVAEGISDETSWESRVADYADTCVCPEGISGFEPRIVDFKNRYGLTDDSDDIRAWRKNAKLVEANLNEHPEKMLKIDWDGINLEETKIETKT